MQTVTRPRFTADKMEARLRLYKRLQSYRFQSRSVSQSASSPHEMYSIEEQTKCARALAAITKGSIVLLLGGTGSGKSRIDGSSLACVRQEYSIPSPLATHGLTFFCG
mmetsp:Transcript_6752/g.14809  ORF Transcript_6752/g.14809 Transcript_6752/m.14809 type:complete len:108 (+) Transcript_6752:484-807(+)